MYEVSFAFKVLGSSFLLSQFLCFSPSAEVQQLLQLNPDLIPSTERERDKVPTPGHHGVEERDFKLFLLPILPRNAWCHWTFSAGDPREAVE